MKMQELWTIKVVQHDNRTLGSKENIMEMGEGGDEYILDNWEVSQYQVFV